MLVGSFSNHAALNPACMSGFRKISGLIYELQEAISTSRMS